MRSQHVDEFNHDPWATNYDDNVRNEADPIRAGYQAVLAWTVEMANTKDDSIVIDLGSGTGNTSAQLAKVERLICVDISQRMTELARLKLAHLASVEFVQADLLEYFATDVPQCDALVSTYAIHHLTEEEKPKLFQKIWATLKPGGRAVFGDLMFKNAAAQSEITKQYRAAGDLELVADFDEEFFWLVDDAEAHLHRLGFKLVETRRFSTLSWGICVEKAA